MVIKAAFTLSYKQIVGNAEPPIAVFFNNMGDSFDNIMKKMLLPLDIKEPFRNYSRQLINLISLNKGIVKVLNFLLTNNIKMVLITGKDGIKTHELLNHFNINHFFDTVITSDEVKNTKPHP